MLRVMCAASAALCVFASIHVTAQQPNGPATPASIVARGTPAPLRIGRALPGGRAKALSAIQGNALNSTDGALANTTVRLRDARMGQIVDTQVTDQAGLFAFLTVDPGSYIVEIMGQDRYSVLAASQILNVGPGEAVSAVVKLPFKAPLAGILGTSTPSAVGVASQAASAGILATQASGVPTCDNLQR